MSLNTTRLFTVFGFGIILCSVTGSELTAGNDGPTCDNKCRMRSDINSATEGCLNFSPDTCDFCTGTLAFCYPQPDDYTFYSCQSAGTLVVTKYETCEKVCPQTTYQWLEAKNPATQLDSWGGFRSRCLP